MAVAGPTSQRGNPCEMLPYALKQTCFDSVSTSLIPTYLQDIWTDWRYFERPASIQPFQNCAYLSDADSYLYEERYQPAPCHVKIASICEKMTTKGLFFSFTETCRSFLYTRIAIITSFCYRCTTTAAMAVGDPSAIVVKYHGHI